MSKRTRGIKAGDKIEIDDGRDHNGQWWWCGRYDPENMYGPFITKDEAAKRSETTIFGPQCEITWGDPAWERPQ